MNLRSDLVLRARFWLSCLTLWVLAATAAIPDVKAGAPANVRAAATENADSTSAALRVLRYGGNAVDAAVAAALVAGVASATSSGIGGGGFAVVWRAKTRKATILDFRETAPANIDASAFENRPFPPERAGKYVGVPGEVAGLFELQRRFGRRPWQEIVEPAVDTAERGFRVQKHTEMVVGFMKKMLTRSADLAALFLPGGDPVATGDRVRNPKLAETLRKIANGGPKAFYEGDVAADIVNAVRARGGSMTLDDLRTYRPVEREPIVVRWEGHDVYTMPPPSAGGLMLAQALRLYGKAELRKLGHNSGAYIHWVAEGLRGALADRMRYIGDPAAEKMDIERLTSGERMAVRKRSFKMESTQRLPRFGLEEHGTHHLVTADAEGNVVSLTTTINRPFGSVLVGTRSGVVLNDELNDFTANGDVAPFNMKESPNRARPGMRPVSSMTPTLAVKDGKAVAALGGSGGMTIAPNVTEVFLGLLGCGLSPSAAIAAKRFSIPTDGGTISLEPGMPEAVRKDLESRGEVVENQRFSSYAVQLVSVDGRRKRPVADPRKHGVGSAL